MVYPSFYIRPEFNSKVITNCIKVQMILVKEFRGIHGYTGLPACPRQVKYFRAGKSSRSPALQGRRFWMLTSSPDSLKYRLKVSRECLA